MRFSEHSPAEQSVESVQVLSTLADEIYSNEFKSIPPDGKEELLTDIQLALEDCAHMHNEVNKSKKLEGVRGMLLGAIDLLFSEGSITYEDAADFYKRLGLSREEVNHIRGAS